MRHIKTVNKQIWIMVMIMMALIFSAACTAGAGSEPAIDSEDESVTISGQVWQWQALEDAADGDESSNITVDDPANYTLELLADGTYTIQADCNSGSGQYTLDDSSLTLEPGPITLAECGPESLSNTYLAHLGDVVTFMLNSEGNLVLNLKADAGNMIFALADEVTSDLEGTNWVLKSLTTESAITSSVIDPEITAVFQDGQLTGSAGCNSYFGGYEIDGSALTLSEMGITAMACDEARNEREGEFLAALQTVTGYRLDGDKLMLLDADGNTVIEMQVAAVMDEETAVSDQLLGIWQWQAFEDSASGDESNDITVSNPANYTLELLTDGTYAIQADCNSGGGQYTASGSSLTLEAGPITLAECGPESLYNLFILRLNEVVTYVIDSDGNLVLNLGADAGNMIFAPAK
ncbi:MAG: META domain-containing protein [Anaerolineales bacterium]|nr:META domain-containing protein [Anaerolineales bacterium]MCB8940481.1 META domain-containing protein [Ardenticatenaceae bacterium]MCP5303781.1 META domain-containing protein [Pseudomonadales bacterium]